MTKVCLPPSQGPARAWGLGCRGKLTVWEEGFWIPTWHRAMLWASVFFNHDMNGWDTIFSKIVYGQVGY